MKDELKARKSAAIEAGKPNVKPAILAVGCLMTPFLLLLLLVLMLGFGTTFYNDSRLRRLERDFAAIPHPKSSTLIKRGKFIGLIGNGDHCDFVVAEVRSHSRSEQIRRFYSNARIAVPNKADDDSQGTKGGTQPVELEFLPAPLPPNYRWKYHGVFNWDLSQFAGQNLYFVIVHNSGENNSLESLCDGRCG